MVCRCRCPDAIDVLQIALQCRRCWSRACVRPRPLCLPSWRCEICSRFNLGRLVGVIGPDRRAAGRSPLRTRGVVSLSWPEWPAHGGKRAGCRMPEAGAIRQWRLGRLVPLLAGATVTSASGNVTRKPVCNSAQRYDGGIVTELKGAWPSIPVPQSQHSRHLLPLPLTSLESRSSGVQARAAHNIELAARAAFPAEASSCPARHCCLQQHGYGVVSGSSLSSCRLATRASVPIAPWIPLPQECVGPFHAC